MSYLIDTNVLSEAMAARPSPEVQAWVAGQAPTSLHFSVGTISEIDFGIARLDAGQRRERLLEWRDRLVLAAGRRIHLVDLPIARAWGEIRARAAAAKRTMPLMDALLAATAEVHGLTLVTRNIRDFEAWGGPVLNPWPSAP